MHFKKLAVIFLATMLMACGNAQTAELERTDAEKYLGIRKVYKRVVRDEHSVIKNLPFEVSERSYVDFAAREIKDKNAFCMAIYYFNAIKKDYRASRHNPPYQAYISVLRVLVADVLAILGEFGFKEWVEKWDAEEIEPEVEYEKLIFFFDDAKNEYVSEFLWQTTRGFCLENGWLAKFNKWATELEEVRKNITIEGN